MDCAPLPDLDALDREALLDLIRAHGRLWTYVRDDRPAGEQTATAVWLAYSEDRRGEHPWQHLKNFTGALQADAYAGFHHLYGNHIYEAACWAHARRKFHDIHLVHASPTTTEALARIGALYTIEDEIRGKTVDLRLRIWQTRARPLLDGLRKRMEKAPRSLSSKSETAGAIRYALSRWRALTRYTEDGSPEIDNSAAERALRAVALGRKNFLLAGSDYGGERAAAMYTLIGSAKLNGRSRTLPPHGVGADRRPSYQPNTGFSPLESCSLAPGPLFSGHLKHTHQAQRSRRICSTIMITSVLAWASAQVVNAQSSNASAPHTYTLASLEGDYAVVNHSGVNLALGIGTEQFDGNGGCNTAPEPAHRDGCEGVGGPDFNRNIHSEPRWDGNDIFGGHVARRINQGGD